MHGALDEDALDCIPHPNAVTQQDGGDYKNYMQSDKGKHPLPFAMAEKIEPYELWRRNRAENGPGW